MQYELPLYHYRHLKRLADLRREPVDEAMGFLLSNVRPNPTDWIGSKWKDNADSETRLVDYHGAENLPRSAVLEKIQGLPTNIRPVTDGPYESDIEFMDGPGGTIGIAIAGFKFFDFRGANSRDQAVFKLIRDKLPQSMSTDQYRIYNTVNSQFLRLVREPISFTMPEAGEVAVDAGAYVGYKALALARCVGPDGRVLAIEVDDNNFALLQYNIKANGLSNYVSASNSALGDAPGQMKLFTRQKGSMAHSLVDFGSLAEKGGNLGSNSELRTVDVVTLEKLLAELNFSEAHNIHISVNGHEAAVTAGLGSLLARVGVLRISVPYEKNGVRVEDLVRDVLGVAGVEILGKYGGAVVAGTAERFRKTSG